MREKVHTLKLSQFAAYLKPRPRDYHKGNAGHVVIVGGCLGYSGAVRLAAMAALRVGAGLVTVATCVEHALLVAIPCAEIMSHGVVAGDDFAFLLKKADAIVIGPGLGQSAWAEELLSQVLTLECPKLLDADALNLLAQHPRQSTGWILTPHPGEAARLLKTTPVVIQQDRVAAIQQIQRQYQGVCVLKGHDSLVLADELSVCKSGNPGMATAGMGDVLSGVIGSLLAQGLPVGDAAKLGVLIHAMSGDLAAKQGERGMIATDLLPYLRQLMNGK